MRTEEEILQKTADYKQRLRLAAAAQQAAKEAGFLPDIDRDLLILALVAKLETLFWLLEFELEPPDIVEELGRLYN